MTTPVIDERPQSTGHGDLALLLRSGHFRGSELEAWSGRLTSVCPSSSSGSADVSHLYLLLANIGTSPCIADTGPAGSTPLPVPPQASDQFRRLASLPVVEQLGELQAALSLTKTLLAQVMRVSRPTLYDWIDGKEPNPGNMARLQTLLRILVRAGISGPSPLDARFVRRPTSLDEPSVVELLGEEPLDEERAVRALQAARELGESESRRRAGRDDRLRQRGFETLSRERRKELLARNLALRDRPK